MSADPQEDRVRPAEPHPRLRRPATGQYHPRQHGRLAGAGGAGTPPAGPGGLGEAAAHRVPLLPSSSPTSSSGTHCPWCARAPRRTCRRPSAPSSRGYRDSESCAHGLATGCLLGSPLPALPAAPSWGLPVHSRCAGLQAPHSPGFSWIGGGGRPVGVPTVGGHKGGERPQLPLSAGQAPIQGSGAVLARGGAVTTVVPGGQRPDTPCPLSCRPPQL